MKNIALKIMYDGTAYHGWQRQKNVATVQETLEKAVFKVCGQAVKMIGCGRTDAGVHAKVYCSNFKTNSTIPLEKLPLAINSYLPPDISVLQAAYASDDFNAILSCVKKEYTYKIYNSRIRDPFYANRAYFYPQKINVELMEKAAKVFVGTQDFAALRSVGTDVQSTVRTVFYYEIEECGKTLNLRVCANGFLYNMARAMVGTLLYVSEGKIKVEELKPLMEKGDRRFTGPTVPPQGLYMTRLWYPGTVGEMFYGKVTK